MRLWYIIDENGNKSSRSINDQVLQKLAVDGIITPDTLLETDAGHRGKAGQVRGLFNAPPKPSGTPAEKGLDFPKPETSSLAKQFPSTPEQGDSIKNVLFRKIRESKWWDPLYTWWMGGGEEREKFQRIKASILGIGAVLIVLLVGLVVFIIYDSVKNPQPSAERTQVDTGVLLAQNNLLRDEIRRANEALRTETNPAVRRQLYNQIDAANKQRDDNVRRMSADSEPMGGGEFLAFLFIMFLIFAFISALSGRK